ncbi:MAG: 2,3-bisphosphoglycerate-independent phosphoglycerate mutase [Planctomycetota bacterium]|nr:2,3-bisphosphoglycerate-independent phosphoglycerate mutase [Planctomycetota bacterium]
MKPCALMLILDGVGDRPLKQFGGLTPLEAAFKPNLDRLASEGITGLMDPISPGIRVGTDVGHLALFGYNPLRTYWGRGPIEAEGVYFTLQEGDVAFRANFATVDSKGIIVSRRAGRIREGTSDLAAALDGMRLSDGTVAIFKPATEHRAVLVLRGSRLSPLVTDSDPGPLAEGTNVLPIKSRVPGAPAPERTASLAEEFTRRAREILLSHPVNVERQKKGLPPANYILLRGAGTKKHIRPLTERFKIKAACVVAESTIIGIARMAGFTILTSPRFTANLDTDVEGKMKMAADALKEYDLVVLHYKGTDIASHDADAKQKKEFIERVDSALGNLLDKTKTLNLYIAVTSDHSTPVSVREHSADPVPVILWGPDVRVDNVVKYGERACAAGGLRRITANGFLLTLLDYLDVTYRFGS